VESGIVEVLLSTLLDILIAFTYFIGQSTRYSATRFARAVILPCDYPVRHRRHGDRDGGPLMFNHFQWSRTRSMKCLSRCTAHLLVLTFLLVVTFCARAQQHRIDSLTQRLEAVTEDTARVNVLIGLSTALLNRDIKATARHADSARTLAQKIDYPSGLARALNLTGMVHDRRGQLNKALKSYRESLAIREEIGDRRGAGSCLLNIGNIYMRRGAWKKARENYEQSLEIQTELQNTRGMAVSYGSLGIILKYEAKYDQAIEQFTRSRNLAESIGLTQIAAMGTMNIGLILGIQGNHREALKYHQNSLKQFEAVGNKHSTATCLINIGTAYQYLQKYTEALEQFQRSLTLQYELENKGGIASCLSNIGVIYERKGDLKDAHAHYQKSLALYRELGKKHGIVQTLFMIGEVHRKRRAFDEALPFLEESLDLAEQLGDKRWISFGCTTLGAIHSDQGEYKKALPYLERGLALKEELGEMAAVSDALCKIGWHYHSIGDTAKARMHLERGLRIATDLHAPESIDCALARLHKYNAATGNYERAYQYSRQQIRHRDSTRRSDERLQLQELMEKYEAEQREREIEMLERDKAMQSLEIERRNEEIRRHHVEALQRMQKIELLSREAEIQQLEVAMTTEQLKNKEAEAIRSQQTIDLLEKDQKLKNATLDQETTLRNAIIAGAVLLVIIGLLIFRRMRDKRHTIELKAEVAEAHARTADMEKLRFAAEAERREREAQQRFARGLLEAQETERKRLAGELHDSLGQDLIVVKNQLLLLRETTTVNGDLDNAIVGIGETLEDVRRLSRDLRPYQLDRYGIGKAIEAMVARANESTRIQFTTVIGNVDGIWDKNAEACIYRIVQEGTSNILKHADARNASIKFSPENGTAKLLIEDDGKGFIDADPDATQPAGSGFGMKGMTERAEILGGSMSILSQPGQGTTITITLPLPAPPASIESVSTAESEHG